MIYHVMSWERPGYRVLRTFEGGPDYREIVPAAKVYAKPGRLIVLWRDRYPVLLLRFVPELGMVAAFYVGVTQ